MYSNQIVLFCCNDRAQINISIHKKGLICIKQKLLTQSLRDSDIKYDVNAHIINEDVYVHII